MNKFFIFVICLFVAVSQNPLLVFSDTEPNPDIKPIVEVLESSLSDETLNDLLIMPKGKIKALVFLSLWCPSCRVLKPVLDQLKSDMKNIQFIEYDIDRNKDILKKFDIASFPRMIILDKDNKFIASVRFNQNEELMKYPGPPMDDRVYSGIKEYLNNLANQSNSTKNSTDKSPLEEPRGVIL